MSESAQQPVEGVGSAGRRKSDHRVECPVALFVIGGVLVVVVWLAGLRALCSLLTPRYVAQAWLYPFPRFELWVRGD